MTTPSSPPSAGEPREPAGSAVGRARRLWPLLLGQAIQSGGMALSFPFMALYLHRERGLPMLLVGGCLGFVILTAALSQGLGGELSDILGRRRVMISSMWGRVAAVLLLALAMSRGWPYPALIALHLASSFAGNFFDPAAWSWIADHTDAAERARAYGLMRIAANLGWAVGPAAGGLMAGRSYPLLFCLTAAACAVEAVLVMALIRDNPQSLRRDAFEVSGVLRAAADARFLRFCLCGLLIAMVMAQLVISLSVHATDFIHLTEVQVGLLFSLNGALVAFLQYPLSDWWSRFRLTSALTAGSALYAAGYFWVGFAESFGALAAAMVVVTFGEMTVSPSVRALAVNMAPGREKGRYLGFSGFMQQLGKALGPVLGGLGLQYVSPRWTPGPWVGVTVLGAAAAAGFSSLRPDLSAREEGLEPDVVWAAAGAGGRPRREGS